MKKIVLTLSMMFLLLTSCSKADSISEINTQRITDVKNQANKTDQQLMYQLLSPGEKYTLWSEKLKSVIDDNQLNESQKDLVTSLLNELSEDLFNDGEYNDKKEVFKDIYVKEFLVKAQKEFESEFIYATFFTINSKYMAPITIEEGGGSGGYLSDCTCNVGSSFTCGLGTGVECGSANCRSSSNGCGFLFIHECDGRCKIFG